MELKQNNIYSSFSNITININGPGRKSIFSASCGRTKFPEPKYVYINNILQETVSDKYDFNETENNIKLVWEDKISNCNCMFQNCGDIIKVDLSSFDFSLGITANCMFLGCTSLAELIFPSSGSIKVNDAGAMFYGCKSLVSLNISNFDISTNWDFGYTFRDCESLTSLDLSNFITSSSYEISGMFQNCKNLEFLNLSNAIFETADYHNDVFKGARNLVICNKCNKLRSFVSAQLDCIVIDCSLNWRTKQKRLNPENNECITDCSVINYKYDYLSKCYNICPDGTYNNNYICNDCHPDCKICDKSPDVNNSNCISCSSQNKFLLFGNCVDNCTNGYYIDEIDPLNKICNCELKKCSNCSKESFEKNLCISCSDGYYQKYDEMDIYVPYIECYQSLEGYYLDINNNESVYKKCYETCKTCNISGNESFHNCIECSPNYFYEIKYSVYKNCYMNCYNYHYFDNETNTYYCTENSECPEKYDKLIYEKRECVQKCYNDKKYKYEFQKRCYEECPTGSLEQKNNTKGEYNCDAVCPKEKPFEMILTQKCVKNCQIKDINHNLCLLKYDGKDIIELQDIILNNIEYSFTSEYYNTSFVDLGEDEIIITERMNITLTTIKNQRDNKDNNVTNVDIGDCENLLRKQYKLSKNEILYMKKIDVIQEGMKIPKIEYDIYYKFNNSYLIKLNLTVCENSKLSISIPFELTESLEKLNSGSRYYNDVCFATTSEEGTDISLKDRRNEFLEGNKTICQDNCDFEDYNYTTQKIKCSCNVKQSPPSFADMIVNKTKLFESFKDIKNIANINILHCYKVLFSKEGLLKNFGSYMLLLIILLHVIFILVFYLQQIGVLKAKIKTIFLAIKNIKLFKGSQNKNSNEEDKSRKDNTTSNNQIIVESKKILKKNKGKKLKHNKNKRNKKLNLLSLKLIILILINY